MPIIKHKSLHLTPYLVNQYQYGTQLTPKVALKRIACTWKIIN